MKNNFIQDEDHDKVILDIINKIIEKTIKQSKHSKGQYFTTNIILKQKVFEFITNNPQTILEPSVGFGNFIPLIMSALFTEESVTHCLCGEANETKLLSSLSSF